MSRMIINAKARISIILILLTVVCITVALHSWNAFKAAHRNTLQRSPKRLVAVIDAGHGAFTKWGLLDYGATYFGIKEADVTIEIAKRLQDKLEKQGWIAVTTRDGEFTPFGLIDRAELSSIVGANVFVSIHTNSSRDRHPNGLSVHYWNEGSKHLANLMQTILLKKLGMKDRGIVKQPLTVLVWATIPAVLIELGFISNPSEARCLSNPQFQEKAANAIAEALTLWACSQCEEETPCFLLPRQ